MKDLVIPGGPSGIIGVDNKLTNCFLRSLKRKLENPFGSKMYLLPSRWGNIDAIDHWVTESTNGASPYAFYDYGMGNADVVNSMVGKVDGLKARKAGLPFFIGTEDLYTRSPLNARLVESLDIITDPSKVKPGKEIASALSRKGLLSPVLAMTDITQAQANRIPVIKSTKVKLKGAIRRSIKNDGVKKFLQKVVDMPGISKVTAIRGLIAAKLLTNHYRPSDDYNIGSVGKSIGAVAGAGIGSGIALNNLAILNSADRIGKLGKIESLVGREAYKNMLQDGTVYSKLLKAKGLGKAKIPLKLLAAGIPIVSGGLIGGTSGSIIDRLAGKKKSKIQKLKEKFRNA